MLHEPVKIGDKEFPAISQDRVQKMLDEYYKERNWDLKTTRPTDGKLKSLGLDFVLQTLDSSASNRG